MGKAFGKTVALEHVSLTVPRGTVFALLGPNGSGKTTLVHVLSTLRRPDSGRATVLGHDLRTAPEAIRDGIGVTGQFSAVDGMLTGRENLQLMAKLYKVPHRQRQDRVRTLLERFDLVEAGSRPPATYSGGMRRRLDLAMTLIGNPELIFLDEPTTGLDPRSRQTMWKFVRELVAEGVTVFLTTQYLQEADELADNVALLDHGHIVAQGTPAQLKRQVTGAHVRLHFADFAAFDAAARSIPDSTEDADSLILQVPLGEGGGAIKHVLDQVPAGLSIVDITVHKPDLDDVFFSLTSNKDDAITDNSSRNEGHR